jgi:hypothetical protein
MPNTPRELRSGCWTGSRTDAKLRSFSASRRNDPASHGPVEGAQMSTNRAKAATLMAAALLAVLPTAAVAQDTDNDPSTWVTTTDSWISAGTADASLTVTDVWLTRLDGFDRLTFETRGDGEAGWSIRYVGTPTSPESGATVPVTGGATLEVTLTGIVPPGDEPDGTTAFSSDLPGADGGAILEVVNDGSSAGQHTFFVGLDSQLPYRVVRVADPKGIVVDLVHAADAPDDVAEDADDDADDDAEEDVVPAGGVEAGWGGPATSPLGRATMLSGLLLLLLGARLFGCRARPE